MHGPVAIFGDIHANLEALEAVEADMRAMGVAKRICVGDLVGYAANPAECVDRVRRMGCPVVQGNHDAAIGGGFPFDYMKDDARAGIEFARRELTDEQKAYLVGLPLVGTECECTWVHASLDEPASWKYIGDGAAALWHFRLQEMRICFCGHTHVPRVWFLNEDETVDTVDGHGRVPLPERGKVLVNVGSVGQPRDLNPEACYVLADPGFEWVEYRRVAYDITKARRRIGHAGLPRFSGQRLELGR